METLVSSLSAPVPGLLTSSEVELMETLTVSRGGP